MEGIEHFKHYCDLGYDVSFTMLFGKEGIRMNKRYSYKTESPIMCEQMFRYSEASDLRLREALLFLYEDIREQELSGKIRVSTEEYLKQ
jgi:hypothetical protein